MALLPLIVFRTVLMCLTLYGFVDTGKRIWTIKRRFYDPLPALFKQQLLNLFKGTPETRARTWRWFVSGVRYVYNRHGQALLPNLLLLLLLTVINVLSFTLLDMTPS